MPRLHRDTTGESGSLAACPQLRGGTKPELLDHGNAVMQQGAGAGIMFGTGFSVVPAQLFLCLQ